MGAIQTPHICVHAGRLRKSQSAKEHRRNLEHKAETPPRPFTIVQEVVVSREAHQMPQPQWQSRSASSSSSSVPLQSLHGSSSLWLNRRAQPLSSPKVWPRNQAATNLDLTRQSSASGSSTTLVQPQTPPQPPIVSSTTGRSLDPSPPISVFSHHRLDMQSVTPKRPSKTHSRSASVATSLSMYSQMSYPHALQSSKAINKMPAMAGLDGDADDEDDGSHFDGGSIRTHATLGSLSTSSSASGFGQRRRPRRRGQLRVMNQRSVGSSLSGAPQVDPSRPSDRARGLPSLPLGKSPRRRKTSIRSVPNSVSTSIGSKASSFSQWAERINEVQEDMKSFLDLSADPRSQWWDESSEPTTPTVLNHGHVSSTKAGSTVRDVSPAKVPKDIGVYRDSAIMPPWCEHLATTSTSPTPTLAYVVVQEEGRNSQESSSSSRARIAIETYRPVYPQQPQTVLTFSNRTRSVDSGVVCPDYDYNFAVDTLVHGQVDSFSNKLSHVQEKCEKSSFAADDVRNTNNKRFSTVSSHKKLQVKKRRGLIIGYQEPGFGRAKRKQKQSLLFRIAKLFARA